MKIVSIDPSVNRVGWAICKDLYQDADDVWHDDKSDWDWGYWDISGNSLSFKLREVAEWCILTFGGIEQDDILVLEWPAFFGSEKGQVAASMGHTLGLAAVDAYIAGFFRLPPNNVKFITANQWKGNISKEITRKRFFHRLGQKQIFKVDHNAVDAVMLLHEYARRARITFRITSSTAVPEFPTSDESP